MQDLVWAAGEVDRRHMQVLAEVDDDPTLREGLPELARRVGPLPKPIAKATRAALAVRDPDAPMITDSKGRPEPDPSLRDNENVPLTDPINVFDQDPAARLASPAYREAVDAYMATKVLPYVEDAWVDHSRTRMGYEIPLIRAFALPTRRRPLEAIDRDLRERASTIADQIMELSS